MTESPDTEAITFKVKKTYVFLALGLLAGSVGGFMAGFSVAGSSPEAQPRAIVSPTPTSRGATSSRPTWPGNGSTGQPKACGPCGRGSWEWPCPMVAPP